MTDVMTFNQIALQEQTVAARMIATIDAAPTGFIFIKGYLSKKTGQTQDIWAIKGANYGNTVAKSIRELDDIEADANLSVSVRWKEWINNKTGLKTTAACKDKRLEDKSATMNAGDDLMLAALATVRKGLENPRDPSVSYEKEGHGVYSHKEHIYLRDCRLVHKNVIEEGDKIITSSFAVAAADVIRRKLAVGKYRCYRLDSRFESISVGGEVVLPPDCDDPRESIAAEQTRTEEGVIA